MKKFVSLLLVLTIALSTLALTGCAKKETADKTIKVGASATPHAEILEQVKETLAADGWTLEIVVFDDYVLPNQALTEGELDANYFQHAPYLNSYNES
ncbi:MAG: metal ABC transporter substrate-binding protein, partial [Oscillospiraceae bacterium]|nr:metal ABC transporter substrate-binding protein [Oscillospiraceae bacterium]